MRVGLVSTPWVPVPPPAYGGTEAVLDRLARGLQQAGHDVLLAAAPNSTCPVPQVPARPLADIGLMGASTREAGHVVRAYVAFADQGADLIHDHTVCGALYRPRPAGVPVVATNHGPFHGDAADVFRAAAPDTAVVAISQAQAARTDIRVAAVIHHGLDVSAVPVGSGDGGYALFLGRMSPDKGVREAALVARHAGIPLLIGAKMQEPAERDYFSAEVAPLLGSCVSYVGEVGHDDKFELLGGALALLNPIQWPEPFGLVMIEALACGTPVVATPYGAAPEIVQDGLTGFLSTDYEELTRGLHKASRLDRGACRADAHERFSTRRMVEDHLRLYERLLATALMTSPSSGPPAISGAAVPSPCAGSGWCPRRSA